ncbi:class I SAM-dependent methyltransferase [Anabaenopsis sp. FSS-46]|uniref:methyltransferase domain-containing protein n=1 Tax=Anabaenopsis sp. FSS-46 TaxID=2971766 RepID=UPI002476C298|nr:methyltransferase domain-containing protein [Anabaenopsis sp. FSS-46]MDH6100725.1 class I SAM-dependent methyltransferase [Anabaenopsis sp. FSS-46]
MNKIIPKIEFFMQSLFVQQEFCPHCKSHKLKTVAKKYRVIKIQHCDDCGLFFTSPIYKSWLISDFYNKAYIGGQGLTTDIPTSEKLSELIKQEFRGSDKYFGNRITSLVAFSKGLNLLEIGSSWGYFIYQAQLQGFNATGIEISDTRREFGKENLGVRMLKHISELKSRKFDIIYTAHTLEHFTDLSSIFVDISDHLKVGGKLVIEVPNFDFFADGNSVLPIIGAVHPMGFCSDFFQRNLPKYGLKILGFFDGWEKFPNEKVCSSTGGIVLLVAEKIVI